MYDLSQLFLVSQSALSRELQALVPLSARFGLTLTTEELTLLAEARSNALSRLGRVELQGGILKKLAFAFCDSAFIDQHNYASTLAELIPLFYSFKNDALDEIGDDDLIAYMRSVFEGPAQGDLSYLSDITLSDLCRAARSNEAHTPWEGSVGSESSLYDE